MKRSTDRVLTTHTGSLPGWASIAVAHGARSGTVRMRSSSAGISCSMLTVGRLSNCAKRSPLMGAGGTGPVEVRALFGGGRELPGTSSEP